jgi:hypothetical protein
MVLMNVYGNEHEEVGEKVKGEKWVWLVIIGLLFGHGMGSDSLGTWQGERCKQCTDFEIRDLTVYNSEIQ